MLWWGSQTATKVVVPGQRRSGLDKRPKPHQRSSLLDPPYTLDESLLRRRSVEGPIQGQHRQEQQGGQHAVIADPTPRIPPQRLQGVFPYQRRAFRGVLCRL